MLYRGNSDGTLAFPELEVLELQEGRFESDTTELLEISLEILRIRTRNPSTRSINYLHIPRRFVGTDGQYQEQLEALVPDLILT